MCVSFFSSLLQSNTDAMIIISVLFLDIRILKIKQNPKNDKQTNEENEIRTYVTHHRITSRDSSSYWMNFVVVLVTTCKFVDLLFLFCIPYVSFKFRKQKFS